MEELVDELGASFLSADLDLTAEPRTITLPFMIDRWLKVLKTDKPAIFTAASHAQRAADHLNTFRRRDRWAVPSRGAGVADTIAVPQLPRQLLLFFLCSRYTAARGIAG